MISGKLNSATALPLEDQTFVALQKTADFLAQQAEQLLKSSGLTGTQYNVLRILRGAQPEGLACRAIGERMICRDSDMTRLLDRLEKRGWIIRQRQTADRRVVKARITADGLHLLQQFDQPVRELHKRQFRHLSAEQLKKLTRALEDIRGQKEE